MKLTLMFIPVLLCALACSEKDNSTPSEGLTENLSYRLIQVLNDPGDGSGTFVSVSSSKVITFYPDGTLTSNGSICENSVSTGVSSTGTYSAVEMTISPDDCGSIPILQHTYEIQGDFLIISYPCIEACQAKFERIE